MLPGVETQQWLQLDATRRKLGGPPFIARNLVAHVALGRALIADGVHVSGLGAPMGARVGGAGEVSGQKTIVTGAGTDKPNEAGAEHGGGSDDEFTFEGLDGGEGGLELLTQDIGHFGARRGDALEEEVIVMSHGRPVEDGRLIGFPGSEKGDGFGVFVLKLGSYSADQLGGLLDGGLLEGWLDSNAPDVKALSFSVTNVI